jgi:hypothetical protein
VIASPSEAYPVLLFEKGKVYLKEEDGTEFELTVIKKSVYPPPEPPR